jgi:triosephosphate isomerase (TIM)
MADRIPLIAGNWKMNLTLEESKNLIRRIKEGIADLEGVDVLVAPPYTSLPAVKQAIGDHKILLSGQNLHWEPSGAFTGEISAGMLVESGCTHVILGHSERRTLFQETSEMIDLKVKAAIGAHLVPIVCIGETLEEREAARTFDVIKEQLDGSLKNFSEMKAMPSSAILAYEPVWAIGTGKTATPEQAQEVHHFIRQWIANNFNEKTANAVRILYGGSVKPENANDLMSRSDIDGALVGGASLKADLFVPIIRFRES